ncbi:tyrosine--tRNA ligase [Edaphocola flava]|uniref:tyrosine--tRNA ligase n=1 Tax=Edaphocola flava TaxID=2499629 RepID=UPI00100B6F4D|nr:tyrosine--tRNA ligase [Edaphocola flava]
MKNFIPELRERGLLQDIIPGTEELLEKELVSGYVGFDPTADSLHIGSMLPIILLKHMQLAGHKPIALIGGATGMIGDPTGKSAERNLLDEATIEKNIAGIRKQLEKFIDFDEQLANKAEIVNNNDWIGKFSFLDFIRDVGKHITVNYMLAKDSVQKRLEYGLSFTEFTYQLIQGYDFFHLYTTQGVKLQFGGGDQWGNIVTGTEFIRRKAQGEAFAFTCPLLKKADGGKFGKTESGNIWLDRNKTSPYVFYQYWLNVTDDDAKNLIRIFTFIPVAEINELIAAHDTAPHLRMLQKRLAEEVTTMVHSKEDLEFAQQATEILFGKATEEALTALSEQQLLEVMDGVPQVTYSKAALEGEGIDLITFFAESGIFPSKGEARKMLQSGGVSMNKNKIQGIEARLEATQLLNDKYVLFQKGKKQYYLAVFE